MSGILLNLIPRSGLHKCLLYFQLNLIPISGLEKSLVYETVPRLTETAYRKFMASWILGPDISISVYYSEDIFSLE